MLQKQLCREHKLCGSSFKLIYKTIIDIEVLIKLEIAAVIVLSLKSTDELSGGISEKQTHG